MADNKPLLTEAQIALAKGGLQSAMRISEGELGELLSIQREEQLPLLPLDVTDGEGFPVPREKRGRGRPKGSTNKRTQEWADYLLGRYGSPLEAMAQIYARPVHLLAIELQCSILDAVKVQLVAAKELAPYVHQKLPVQVDLGEKGLVNLVINTASERFAGRQTSAGTIEIKVEHVPEENEGNSNG